MTYPAGFSTATVLAIMSDFPFGTLVLATGNPFKAAELRALLSALPIEILDLAAFPDAPMTAEDGTSLSDNALLKAQNIHMYCGLPTLADDTGLRVEALGGRPGVASARYAGPQCDDHLNRSKLLRAMKGVEQRQARFETVLALVAESNKCLFLGQCEGRIANCEMTPEGFGYESIFIPNGYTRCFAQLTAQEKNAISHRGRAALKLIRYFDPF